MNKLTTFMLRNNVRCMQQISEELEVAFATHKISRQEYDEIKQFMVDCANYDKAA